MMIYPKKGIGPVTFGMSPKEVSDVMGETVYENWMGGNLNDSQIEHPATVKCHRGYNCHLVNPRI